MFELNGYHILLAAIGATIVLAHWLPRFVSGREPAAAALLIGIGYIAFTWIPSIPAAIDPISFPKPWEVASELCVIVGLFGVGLRIDTLRSWKRWRATVRLLVIAMPLTIGCMAILGWWLVELTLAGGLLLGAVLAPTDPVLAADVQVGRPSEGGEQPVRFALTTEAGLNDGLAFPFVHLALLIAGAGILTPELAVEWLWRDVVYRVVVGAFCGAAIGWVLGFLLFDFPRENALAESEAGVIALAGVLVVYGLTELAEGYGFVAVFISGLTLRRSETRHKFHARLHDFSELIEHALTAILLIGLGAVMPVLLPHLEWSGAAIGSALILVVRPLVGWLSLADTFKTRREKLATAVYGIRGIGSVYYLSYAAAHVDLANERQLWAIVAFTVLLSTVLHGFTASFAVEKATGGGKL